MLLDHAVFCLLVHEEVAKCCSAPKAAVAYFEMLWLPVFLPCPCGEISASVQFESAINCSALGVLAGPPSMPASTQGFGLSSFGFQGRQHRIHMISDPPKMEIYAILGT